MVFIGSVVWAKEPKQVGSISKCSLSQNWCFCPQPSQTSGSPEISRDLSGHISDGLEACLEGWD